MRAIFNRYYFQHLVFCFIIFIPSLGYPVAENEFRAGKEALTIPDYRQAYSCFMNGYKQSNQTSDFPTQISCLLELGKLSTLFSNNDSALFFLNTGKSLTQKYTPSNLGLIANFELALGRLAIETGDVETAGEHYRYAIRLMENTQGVNDIRKGYAYSEYSNYFSFKQQQDSAVYWSKKGYLTLRKLKNTSPEYACPILIQFARSTKEFNGPSLDSINRHYPIIRKLFREALQIARSNYTLPSFEEGKALQNLANTYTDCIRPYFRENYPDAERCWVLADSLYTEAIRVRESIFGKYTIATSTTRYTKAIIYYYHPSLSRKSLSLEKFNEAMQSLDSSFHSKDRLSCPGFSGTKVPYVLSLQLSYKCEALRSLFNETKDTTYLIALHKHNQARLALWDRILSEFNNKDIGQIISIWNFTPFEEAVESAFDLYQLSKESKYLSEIFEYAEKGKNNEYTQLLIKNGAIKIGTEQPRLLHISLESLTKKLDKKTAFIEYIQAPNKDIRDSYAIVVTADKSTLLKLPKKSITDSLQKELLKSMERNDPLAYDSVALKLYNLLLKPVIKAAGAGIDRLIISPSGSYAEVPFDALTVRPSGERDFRKLEYVLKHYAIGYVLNAGITFGRPENQRNTGLSVFFPEIDTMAHLLFSKRQAQWLKERYEGDFHFGKEATLKGFTDHCKNKSVVQISTHSIATRKDDSDGLLLLQDGLIHLKDLYGKQMPVDLMIISVCESGSGRQEYGEGTKSFARSFLYAGAKGAMSTLWCVDEKSTSELLTAFYTEIDEGNDVLQSLSDAKKEYLHNSELSELANPFYWGGLIFTGRPDLKVQISEKSNPLWYVASLFIPTMVLLAFYLRKRFFRL